MFDIILIAYFEERKTKAMYSNTKIHEFVCHFHFNGNKTETKVHSQSKRVSVPGIKNKITFEFEWKKMNLRKCTAKIVDIEIDDKGKDKQ